MNDKNFLSLFERGLNVNHFEIELTAHAREFLRGYFECMVWAEMPFNTADAQRPQIEDLDAYFIQEQVIEALAFFYRVKPYVPEGVWYQCGHDFWLTRNNHGTGFWDRPMVYKTRFGTYHDLLTDIAQDKFGEIDVVWEVEPDYSEYRGADYGRDTDFGNTVANIIDKFGTTKGK